MELTGRIGFIHAEDSAGGVVAIDGHWFDVADALAGPDVGLVQLHGFSSTGENSGPTLDAGAVLQTSLDFPIVRTARSRPPTPDPAATGSRVGRLASTDNR